MDFYSVEYWQENWNSLLNRVENGETIGIENVTTGEKVVMVPADNEILELYKNHDEAP